MKRSVKIGLTLVVIGVVMALIGICFGGGSSAITWDNGFKVMDQKTKRSKISQKSYTFDNVKDINIATALPVRVVTGDVKQATVKVFTYHKLPEMNYQQSHLTITDQQTSSVSRGEVNIEFNITGFTWQRHSQRYQEEIVITVPQSQSLSNLQINGQNSSDVSLSGIQADKITLQHVADTKLKDMTVNHDLKLDDTEETDLNNITTSTATIKSNDGDVTIKNTHISDRTTIQLQDSDLNMHQNHMNVGEINVSDGDINLLSNELSGELNITAQDGDVAIAIGKSSVVAKTQDGDISTFHQHEDEKSTYAYKGTTGEYIISTDDGDISIKQ